MRISKLEVLRADGGWRPFCFLKLSTDDGLIGWSEFVEGVWSPDLGQVIISIGNNILGEDPRHYAKISALLQRITSFAGGGLNHQAIAAIENACLDVTAKSYGVNISTLAGGPVRESINLYWSHCGTFRILFPEIFEKVLGKKRIETIDDFSELGKEAIGRGFDCVKINPALINPGQKPRLLNPGFVKERLDFSKELDISTIDAVQQQVSAVLQGLEKRGGLMLDLNFSSSVNSLKRLLRVLNKEDLKWIELDLLQPAELARIRNLSLSPVASLETLHGRKTYLPYFDEGSADIAIIDVIWNGFSESRKIADLSETYEINVAPHNFYGPLSDLISAQFCMSTPNLSIMEIEADDVPWKYDLLTTSPVIKEGKFHLPAGPGWGADINEDAVGEHLWHPK